MTSTAPPAGNPDPQLQTLFEVSHRLLAGMVPGGTVARLADRIRAEPGRYPWEGVAETVLAPAAEPRELVQRGLKAQRDWILRAAAARPVRQLKLAGKTLLARIVAQGLFFLLYSAAVVVLLLLARLKWDWFDIYRLLEPLQALIPGLGRGG